MSAKEMLQKYNARLAKEGWLQSLLCGLSVGFSANIVCSFLFFLFGIKLFWVSILLFVAATAVATPIFYYARFRKNIRQVAARVDTFGLEERILTMAQYEDDDSYLARRQREDAEKALRSVEGKMIKIAISVPMMAMCIGTLLFGVATTTVSALSEQSLLSLIEQGLTEEKNPTFVDLEYGVMNDEGGRVEGETFQSVPTGTDAEAVQAIADADYVFVGWSDGYASALRVDHEVNTDITVYAIFVPVEDNEEEDTDPDPSQSESGEGDGEGDSNGAPPSPTAPSPNDGDGEGGGEGGGSKPNNQVNDGDTYYGDVYGEGYSGAQNATGGDSGYTSGESSAIGNYFGNIAP